MINMSLTGEMHCKTLEYDNVFNFVSVGLAWIVKERQNCYRFSETDVSMHCTPIEGVWRASCESFHLNFLSL